jgi:hypothetical protein
VQPHPADQERNEDEKGLAEPPRTHAPSYWQTRFPLSFANRRPNPTNASSRSLQFVHGTNSSAFVLHRARTKSNVAVLPPAVSWTVISRFSL